MSPISEALPFRYDTFFLSSVITMSTTQHCASSSLYSRFNSNHFTPGFLQSLSSPATTVFKTSLFRDSIRVNANVLFSLIRQDRVPSHALIESDSGNWYLSDHPLKCIERDGYRECRCRVGRERGSQRSTAHSSSKRGTCRITRCCICKTFSLLLILFRSYTLQYLYFFVITSGKL